MKKLTPEHIFLIFPLLVEFFVMIIEYHRRSTSIQLSYRIFLFLRVCYPNFTEIVFNYCIALSLVWSSRQELILLSARQVRVTVKGEHDLL
jgi:hypothetical protein